MRKYVLTAVLSAFVAVFLYAHAVPHEIKHAPTLQSCSADLNLWSAQIPNWPDPSPEQLHEGVKTLTVEEMSRRVLYLSDCIKAHPVLQRSKPDEPPTYFSLFMFYNGESGDGYLNFLVRHNLFFKFKQEDETGKR